MNNGIQEVEEKTVDKMIDSFCDGKERKGCKRVFCLNKKYQTYIAVDDSTNDCWVESFETREKAIRWLEEGLINA